MLSLIPLWLLGGLCLNNESVEPFHFEGQMIQPGENRTFSLPISNDEHPTTLPITVFHGTRVGPISGMTAGVHGYEYPDLGRVGHF